MKRKFVNQESNFRIDKFLTEQLNEEFGFSRAYVQKLFNQNLVLVNEKVSKANYSLKPGDIIEVDLVEIVSPVFEAEDLPLTILYEDDDLIVVDKPNNMVVHPAVGNYSGTLVNGLMFHFKQLSDLGGTDRPGIVHRLDKQTTGVMLVAKNNATHQKLSAMFANHLVEKTYLALVDGVISENEAIINAPIGRSQTDRKKMAVTATNSKPAITKFTVLERYPTATFVEVKLETGRTHQIRVHFQYIHHPVLNDPVYGASKEAVTDYGQYLHSYRISFTHPTTGIKMQFESPIPKEFNDKIIELRNVEV